MSTKDALTFMYAGVSGIRSCSYYLTLLYDLIYVDDNRL